MANLRQHVPQGVQDVSVSECITRRKTEETILNVFRSYAYQEVQTPMYEHYDVFLELGGELDQEKLIKFFDKHGRILTLRPDLTTPIARLCATQYTDAALPLRFCYLGKAFRTGEAFAGMSQHEFTQAGVELIGINSVEADAEIVAITINTLLSCGLNDFLIELGQVNFFKGLAAQAGLNDEDTASLSRLIDKKDQLAIENFVFSKNIKQPLADLFVRLAQAWGDISLIDEMEKLDLCQMSKDALSNLRAVYNLLEERGLSEYVSFDIGMVGSIDYYTGIIFKGFTHALGMPVCGGGRYDGLIGKFGKDLPATGVAIGVDRLISALYRQNAIVDTMPEIEYVGYLNGGRKDAFMLSDILRKCGSLVALQVEEKPSVTDAAVTYLCTGGGNVEITQNGTKVTRSINEIIKERENK